MTYKASPFIPTSLPSPFQPVLFFLLSSLSLIPPSFHLWNQPSVLPPSSPQIASLSIAVFHFTHHCPLFFPIYLFISFSFSFSVGSTEKVKDITALVVVLGVSHTTTTTTYLIDLSSPLVPEPFLPGATLLTLQAIPLTALSLL